jgi:outer membrane beta-barrel protein
MLKKVIVAALTTILAISAQAQTGGSKPSAPSKEERGSDRLDLKKLEDKYWSAKDTDFNVVQNRTYTKDNKFFASLSYGPLVNDAYSYGRMTNFAAGYYFNERMGLEVAYESGSLRNSDSTDQFINDNQFAPNYNTFKNYTSLNFIIVPFYAKMSFWDRKILYFDMQFAAGVGQMKYTVKKVTGIVDDSTNPLKSFDETKSAMGYNLDVTQQLFFHENFAIRFDIKNKWSKQSRERYYIGTDPETSRGLGEINQQDTTMLLGLTVFF